MNQKLKVKWLFVGRKREHGGEDKNRSNTYLNMPCVIDLILELQKYFM